MPDSTLDPHYADRLNRRSEAAWKRWLDVQRPYRWNLQRLELGRVLDVGCGVGRNLAALGTDSVGVDHNERCVEFARSRGLRAYPVQEFAESPDAVPHAYDSLLFAHVLEHMDEVSALGVIEEYLPYLRPGGRIVAITPQEAGFRSDATHVRFVDFSALRDLAERLGLEERQAYSFPFPRWAGGVFTYNEFVFVASARGTLK